MWASLIPRWGSFFTTYQPITCIIFLHTTTPMTPQHVHAQPWPWPWPQWPPVDHHSKIIITTCPQRPQQRLWQLEHCCDIDRQRPNDWWWQRPMTTTTDNDNNQQRQRLWTPRATTTTVTTATTTTTASNLVRDDGNGELDSGAHCRRGGPRVYLSGFLLLQYITSMFSRVWKIIS